MTTTTPLSGNAPALSADDEATKVRIAQWCEWFDLTPPALETDEGALLLTDGLVTWCHESGANMEWLFCGKMEALARAYRKANLDRREFVTAVEKLDATEKRLMETALRGVVSNQVSMDSALAALTVAIGEYRAKKVA